MRKTGLMMLSRAELACCCCTQSGSVLHCFCGQLRVNSNSINNNNNSINNNIHTSINNYFNNINYSDNSNKIKNTTKTTIIPCDITVTLCLSELTA